MTTLVSRWNGTPLTEYSKDELINIVEELAGMLERERQSATQEQQTLITLRKART